jgi:adenosylcobinamide kinase/adenosylcobinamide-phosphate guanylyltransferase
MNRGQFYLITGGARSGKSSYAEKLALSLNKPVTYLATAETGDQEMRERVRKHRERRPAEWGTVEEPLRVAAALEGIGEREQVVLIDCLTMLVTNLMYAGPQDEPDLLKEERVTAEVRRLAEVAGSCPADVILVTNEVGLGVVPASHDGRLFRDLAGLANQISAAAADRVFWLVSGMAVDIKQLHQPL